MEFSKKLLIVSYAIAIMVTICSFYFEVNQYNASNINNITITLWGEVSVGNAFYYWKTKEENKVKILKKVSTEDRYSIKDYFKD